MIPKIRNAFLRRSALVLAVAGIVVTVGPMHLVNAVLKWVEDEFDVDLRASWKGSK